MQKALTFISRSTSVKAKKECTLGEIAYKFFLKQREEGHISVELKKNTKEGRLLKFMYIK